MSQQQVRISLLDKKADNAMREADDRVDKIQSKLDEAKKKERYVRLVAWYSVLITEERDNSA